jgi:hypothetical protein
MGAWTVSVSELLEGPVEQADAAFRGDPGAWLPVPARRRGGERWTVTLRAGPLSRSVACTVGPVWEVAGTAWRRLGWQPESERGDPLPVAGLLPVLDGEIGLARENGRVVLLINGTYTPPVGILGKILDRLAGRRVAHATARAFLRAAASALYSDSRSSRARRSAR